MFSFYFERPSYHYISQMGRNGLWDFHQIKWFPAQTPQNTQPGFGNQSRYKASSEPRVEIDNNAVIDIG